MEDHYLSTVWGRFGSCAGEAAFPPSPDTASPFPHRSPRGGSPVPMETTKLILSVSCSLPTALRAQFLSWTSVIRS